MVIIRHKYSLKIIAAFYKYLIVKHLDLQNGILRGQGCAFVLIRIKHMEWIQIWSLYKVISANTGR